MTLDEFMAEEHDRLDAFEQFWRDGMRDDPDAFPNDLGAGDWDEALMIFVPGDDA